MLQDKLYMFPTTLSCNIPQRQPWPKTTWDKKLKLIDDLELNLRRRKEINLSTSNNLDHVEPASSNDASEYIQQNQSDADLSDAIEHVLQFRAASDGYASYNNVSNQSPETNPNVSSNHGFNVEYPY
ncbi:hypothetical protein PHYBLDRAFT_178889 [Phycomyces blakesleeanus NRRL 1555(-)]|uniref:Uncharacterized protein n=1 Tax=Phycomyces blakesleeanus (strain ATCC 8743b / DSM 1359 / FGSC 10004 / NBRC 33097 / NRRL 1555) TaxID=763407 RepID=A0A167RBT7_PHYB8|nr:hypothetical protein PHYBLDRAFT_178889 [Phycomyces blakesleeanus NRRL 1555(-)]OAD81307.1 hypothetical protein PHYBLDRAFT_178889 [Phycomyces blakesleeanus NRRL 1555(-)]|eukprot:XP_018299347.1 hypothetical protein PHYBLDRAFT_178889 [Phycomyces blakesleeanus NRRL 1555(-)]